MNVSVAEKLDKEGKKVLVVYMPGSRYLPERQSDRQIMTPDDAKMVLELVKVRPFRLHLSQSRLQIVNAKVILWPLAYFNRGGTNTHVAIWPDVISFYC